jgi:hypothetical protein
MVNRRLNLDKPKPSQVMPEIEQSLGDRKFQEKSRIIEKRMSRNYTSEMDNKSSSQRTYNLFINGKIDKYPIEFSEHDSLSLFNPKNLRKSIIESNINESLKLCILFFKF